ncbi:TolB family protein [Synechococcus sp. R65.1]|jgi:Tol biopolymer transport system component|uniref:TolB family protein n=1 Tax=Synechococcus sp. R65.1 TaxID=2964524 RepID=UPI0039C2B8B7
MLTKGQIPFSPVGWVGKLCLAGLSLGLLGCSPAGFRTPPSSLTNSGLNSIFPDGEPAFSGDGRYLVFSSARGGSQAIFLYDLVEQRLVDLPGLNSSDVAASSPDISADGRYIVYVSNALGKSEIFLYDRETRRVENISSRVPGDVRNPTISGDGRFIAFESNGRGQWNIEIFDRGPAATQPPAANSSNAGRNP